MKPLPVYSLVLPSLRFEMITSSAVAQPAAKPTIREVLASPKMLAIMVLGAASGFPNQLTESALQAWLKDSGASITTIGIFSYVSVFYLLKFVWAPVMDRYPLPVLGRRRGWILATQLGIACALALLSVQQPTISLTPIAICAALVVFLSASQDIAFDAYRTDVAKPHERGLAAAANNLGYRTAAWLAFAFALVLADAFGWRIAFLFLGATMAAFSIATWLAPEAEYRHAPPRTLKESVSEPLKALLGSPGTVGLIALVVLFKVGDAFALKFFTPFLMDVGFTKTEVALVAKAVMTSSAIAGAIVGGIWMVKLGLLKSMLTFGALQAASNMLYYMLAITGKNYEMMVAAVAIDNFAGAMGNIASVALMMSLCDARYSAFQYALLSALALLPRYGLGYPAGWIADHMGWPTYYIVSFLIAMPGMLLLWVFRNRVRFMDQAAR